MSSVCMLFGENDKVYSRNSVTDQRLKRAETHQFHELFVEMYDSEIYPKRRPTLNAVSCFTRVEDKQQQTQYLVLRRHK